MNENRQIDRIRESEGFAGTGTGEDGAIVDMQEVAGRLIVINERSIYKMIFADKIDPERTTINLPPTIHKLIINKGVEPEIVARIFLTAKTIFKAKYLNENVDCTVPLSLSIGLLSELSLLEKEINQYLLS